MMTAYIWPCSYLHLLWSAELGKLAVMRAMYENIMRSCLLTRHYSLRQLQSSQQRRPLPRPVLRVPAFSV
eukprot:scaffold346810_cov41-Prasinocladus_malaysianus.AAC.2